MRENNISNMQIGDSVAFTLDVVPGEIYRGIVRSIGFGVSAGKPSNKGDLPSIEGSQGWLREPQKFPVIIDLLDAHDISSLRIGGQVDVVVHTQHEHPILDKIGHWQIKISSWLSYVR
jgi:multidrug resistance efflux pump